jgi:hypothetical protein
MIGLRNILIWILAIQELATALEELGYTVDKYDDSTGIYYENKGQVNLYNTEWQVVVYHDLKGINIQSSEIDIYVKYINNLCRKLVIQNWTDCHHFPEISKEKLEQIKRTEDLIREISDHKIQKTRKRRGVFNFIGEISKVLFGTLDNEDAKYYNDQIKHFEENSEDFTKLLKQQLIIVRSSLGAVNNTVMDIEYNQKKVENALIQIKNFLNATMAEDQRDINTLKAKIMVESHIAKAKEALETLQRYLDIILNSISQARKGILPPQLVSPKLVMDALIKSMPSFPKDTLPPFPLSKDSTHLLYKVCDVHVYIESSILGYVITLPLIGRGVFKVYKMIPVPIPLGSHKFAYIETEESNLCIDETKQYYFEMNEENLSKCKSTDSQTRICKQTRPLLSSHFQETCVVKLLQTRREIPKNCDTRLVQIRNTMWTQLDNNAWLYFAPTAESVTVLCSKHDPIDFTLTGVGKLSLNVGCKGYTSFAFLQTSTKVKSGNIKGEDLLSRIPIDIDCLEQIGIHSKISIASINLEFRHIASHIDDLKHASYKISELEEAINEQEWKNNQTSKHAAYSVIVYILLGITSMYIIYKLYKYIRLRLVRTPILKALTAPQGEVRASARTDGHGNIVNINIKTSNESLAVGRENSPLHSSQLSLEEETRPHRSLRPRVSKSYF